MGKIARVAVRRQTIILVSVRRDYRVYLIASRARTCTNIAWWYLNFSILGFTETLGYEDSATLELA